MMATRDKWRSVAIAGLVSGAILLYRSSKRSAPVVRVTSGSVPAVVADAGTMVNAMLQRECAVGIVLDANLVPAYKLARSLLLEKHPGLLIVATTDPEAHKDGAWELVSGSDEKILSNVAGDDAGDLATAMANAADLCAGA